MLPLNLLMYPADDWQVEADFLWQVDAIFFNNPDFPM